MTSPRRYAIQFTFPGLRDPSYATVPRQTTVRKAAARFKSEADAQWVLDRFFDGTTNRFVTRDHGVVVEIEPYDFEPKEQTDAG